MSHYFFTDISRLSSQTTGSEFGPAGVTSSPIHDKYRVTSLHKASANTLAYAVCKSILFVQENSSNANLVNIVLKPLEQPPFNLPKVKFYIYKGVKKSSLIDGNNIATDTDLYDSIILDYAALNTGATTAPKEILGITASVLTTDSISSVFNEANFDHQLPVVKAGDSIGMFDKDGFGFEIHLEAFGFEPTIAEARTNENTILVPQLPSTPTQAEFFEHWHDKEVILNYLDPCAYWGGFFELGIKVFSGTTAALKKESNLVTEVLAKFTNKNKVYIDIRNEFNFSINYFKNYGISATNNTTDVKLTKGSSAQTTVDYYGNNWPILILDGIGFGTTSTNHQVLGISLPCGNGDNPEPIVYFSFARNIVADSLIEFSHKEAFKLLTVNQNYTNIFHLGLYWSTGVASSFVQIKYAKLLTDNLPSPISTQVRSDGLLDCIFDLTRLKNIVNVNTKQVYIEQSIFIDLRKTHVASGMFNLVVSLDSDIITLSILPNSLRESHNKRITPSYVDSETPLGFPHLAASNSSDVNNLLYKTEVSSANETIPLIYYRSRHSDAVDLYVEPDLNLISSLTLTLEQFQDIIDTASNSSLYYQKLPVYLAVSSYLHLLGDNDIQYTEIELSLTGYQINSNVLNTINHSFTPSLILNAYGHI
jgi:hypothetical protein